MRDIFDISKEDMRRIIRDFRSEMEEGLAERRSSLRMIPAYIDRPTGKENGRFMTLDLGGSNFRILEVKLKGNNRFGSAKVEKFILDKRHITGRGEELFDFIASCIKKFIKSEKISDDEKFSLGFTFSFPVEQTGIASGRLLYWTKGFNVSGVVGKDVVCLLNEALKRKGLDNISVVALANDTVGTLMAKAYEDPDCDIGVIIGTGTNACYRENVSNIIKWEGPASTGEQMIINIEWGGFNKLKLTPYDEQLDRGSDRKGEQLLEKMVSGMYLGELARLVISDLIKKKVKSFKTEYMSIIESDRSRNLSAVGGIFGKLGIKDSMLRDRRIYKRICKLISLRAARISAACIAAVIMKIDPDLSRRHTVAIDGTVYERHLNFSKNMDDALTMIFGRKSSLIKIDLAKDGSGKGAAVIAAVSIGMCERQ